MSKPGEDYMKEYSDKLDAREKERNAGTAKPCPSVGGKWVERPMGRGPTFVPETTGCGDYNFPKTENNIPGWPPGDHFPNHPGNPMPDRIWPQEWPYNPAPPFGPKQIEDIMREAEKMIKPAEKEPFYEERTLGDKTRCIDFPVPGHDKTTLSVTLKDGQIVIRGGKNPMALFPRQIHHEFPYNNKDEEVIGAHISKGLLTITIKNIKVEIAPQSVPITGD